MFNKKIFVEITGYGEGLELPNYEKEGDAGLDLRAAIPEGTRLAIPPNDWLLIPCGFKMQLPEGYEAQVRPRSGLALKYGITVLNSPGTVDAGYRGEIGVILINHSKYEFMINRGDRIAQMVIARFEKVRITPINQVSKSKRGEGGFGSTGRI